MSIVIDIFRAFLCKSVRRGAGTSRGVDSKCAGLFDFVMSHYGDEVYGLRYVRGYTLDSD